MRRGLTAWFLRDGLVVDAAGPLDGPETLLGGREVAGR